MKISTYFRINNIKLPLNAEQDLKSAVSKKLRIDKSQISEVNILRRAVDARRKNDIQLIYHVGVVTECDQQQKKKILLDKDITTPLEVKDADVLYGTIPLEERPIVIGSGPAGLLSAYWLAKHGFKPLLLERGKALAERVTDVSNFWQRGEFDETSNVQFGEGGAGTFSDGKLTTRVNDPVMQRILKLFVECGAPQEILFEQKPHVGTDKLRKMVSGLTKQIRELGGEVCFKSHVTDFIMREDKICGVVVNNKEHFNSNAVILACGHSARDTYEVLHKRAVAMETKQFSIGLRVEHPQATIDGAQYGKQAGHPLLGVADYALVHHEQTTGRSAYSFCMCPGGLVVAAASENGGVVVNGMSMHSRSSGVANSALVVNVSAADFGNGPLAGIAFQRHYEQLAYAAGGGKSYQAPGQSVSSFLRGSEPTYAQNLRPTYRPGIVLASLTEILPTVVAITLKAGLIAFERKIQGFAGPEGFLTGVETRTSAPLRIVRRQDTLESTSHGGLYPTGEGAGYAGGIMSAALDGFKVAEAIIRKYQPLE